MKHYLLLSLIYFGFLSKILGQNCIDKRHPLYIEPLSYEGFRENRQCDKVDFMKFKDGSNPLCVLGMKSSFNNKGLGLLCGYKVVKASGEVDVLYGNKLIYSFVMYKSTDGYQWDTIKSNQISKIFTDTIGEYNFQIDKSPISLSTDGNYFYLASEKFSVTDDGKIRYYRSNDLKQWELIVERVEGVSRISGFEFINNGTASMICRHGFPSMRVSLFSKSGSTWKEVLELSTPTYGGNLGSYIQAYIGREIYHHKANGFLFQNREKPYYLYNNSSQNKDYLVFSLTNEPSQDSRVKSGQFNWWTLPKVIYRATNNSNIIFAQFSEGIYRSTDGGLTFKKIWFGGGYPDLYPICSDGTLFLKTSPSNSIYKSIDGGDTWEGVAYMGRLGGDTKVDFLPDGTFLLSTYTGVWRFKEKCKPSENIPSPVVFGTTVITHGYQLWFGSNPTEKDEWVNTMANTILAKVNNRGCIWEHRNNVFEPLPDKCPDKKGENILMFDWKEESNNWEEGQSENAGDRLFSSLIMSSQSEGINLSGLHFIGHSRGTVVNTEAIERLLVLKKDEKYRDRISIDQVTNLDPHDWGMDLGMGVVGTDFDNHPNLDSIDYPKNRKPNNGVISWIGSGFNDTYYQVVDPIYPYGRPVKGTFNVDWSQKAPGHSEIHEYFLKSIKNEAIDQHGYKYSRIVNKTRPLKDSANYYCYLDDNCREQPEFSFFDPMVISGTNRIRGIFNGSFDRGTVGWNIVPDAFLFRSTRDLPPFLPFTDISSFASLAILTNNQTSTLTRERAYFPPDAKSFSFEYKAGKIRNGKLKVIINGKEVTMVDLSEGDSFNQVLVDISEFSDRVVSIRFEFIAERSDNLFYPQLLIDNISLSKKPYSKGLNQTQTSPVPKNKQLDIISSNISSNLNSSFDNQEAWTTANGDVLIVDGVALLRASQKGIPVKFSSGDFRVHANARDLKIRIAKNKIGKGEIQVFFKELDSGIVHELHSESVNNSALKTTNVLLNASKALEGDIDFTKIQPEYNEMKINVSKISGKAGKLEISFINKGSLKHGVYIDEISIE
ncbi:WD40/YVTN/BNR-like repeat-containing protein [Neolewinella lacunae]|nr:hypothetical protein [Neolewinella lacunae]